MGGFCAAGRRGVLGGTVKVASSRKTIQHLTGGIVDTIDVKEGQVVKRPGAGQAEPTNANAQLGIVQAQFLAAQAGTDRLSAEREGKTTVTFSPVLTKNLAMTTAPKTPWPCKPAIVCLAPCRAANRTGHPERKQPGQQEQLKAYQSLKDSRSNN